MDNGQWTKGKPIPEKYRNIMYAWKGGGYDGCIWEMNQGVVTDDGHWDPFHSTGYDGLDCDKWHDEEIRRIKRELGFHVDRYGRGENVEEWYASVRNNLTEEARRKYYGAKPFDNPEYYDPNATTGNHFPDKHREEIEAYVNSHITEQSVRYTTYKEKRAEIDREWHERLDEIFMDQVEAQRDYEMNHKGSHWSYHGPARDGWEEYPLDDGSIKKSCERFCREYSVTVGVMAGVLDALAERGYGVWATCSDCGEQFQLSDYEKFSHLIDENSYHGDGGIGCIFTRIQCERCRQDTECPECYEPNLPTRKEIESGHDYDRWTFRERFVGIWIGVCDCCAYGFFVKNKHWSDELDNLEEIIDKGKAQLDHYVESMKEIGGRSEDELEELRDKNLVELEKQWTEMINEMRDRMEDDVLDHFSDHIVQADDRITVKEVKDYV